MVCTPDAMAKPEKHSWHRIGTSRLTLLSHQSNGTGLMSLRSWSTLVKEVESSHKTKR